MFVGVRAVYEPENIQDIRSGAHAVVLRARILSSASPAQLPAGTRVAIKRPRRPDVEAAWLITERERLLVLTGLGSPGIVEILDHEAEGQPPFIVMPWYDFDQDTWKKERNPTIEEHLRVLMQVSTGLLHLHRAPRAPNEVWIHRDLKPQNILVREVRAAGGDESVVEAVIADLSILKVGNWDSQMSQTGAGTRNYAPPGALLPRKARPDPTIDGFALAVIVFETFTGQRPDVAIQRHLLPAGSELANLAALNDSELQRFQARYEAHRERPLRELVDLSRFEALRTDEEQILFEALLRRMPSDVRSPSQVAEALTRALVGALRPMLEPDPERRQFSLPALYEAFQCGLDILEHARGRQRVRIEGTHVWELDLGYAPMLGGQALVMRARGEGQGAVVAAKITRESGEPAQWLENERQIFERLGPESQSIPRILDHGRTSGGHRFLIMEWFPLTLRSWLEQANPCLERRLMAMALCLDALCGLHEAARTNELCLHRDLKPDNFLVDINDQGLRVVLADLGCGLRTRMSRRTWSTGAFTPPYAPPEQWLPLRAEPNASIDLYAMAVTLYELLVGCVPDAAQQRTNALNEDGRRLMSLLGLASARSADDELELRALSELRSIDLLDLDGCPSLLPSDIARLRQRLFEHLAEQAPFETDARLEAYVDGVTDSFLAVFEPALRVDPVQRTSDSRRLRATLFRAACALEAACVEARATAQPDNLGGLPREVTETEGNPWENLPSHGVEDLGFEPSVAELPVCTSDESLADERVRTQESAKLARQRTVNSPRVRVLAVGFTVGLLTVLTLHRLMFAPAHLASRLSASPAVVAAEAATLPAPAGGDELLPLGDGVKVQQSTSARELPEPADVTAPVSPSVSPRGASALPGPVKVGSPPSVLLSWNCSASGVIGRQSFPKSRSRFQLRPGRYTLVLTNGIGQTIQHVFLVEASAGGTRDDGLAYLVSGDFQGGHLALKSADVPETPSKKLEFLCP